MNLDVKEIHELYGKWREEFVENNPEQWRGPLVSFDQYLFFKFLKGESNDTGKVK